MFIPKMLAARVRTTATTRTRTIVDNHFVVVMLNLRRFQDHDQHGGTAPDQP